MSNLGQNAVGMMAATIMGDLLAHCPDALDDVFGPCRNMSGRSNAETYRQVRIRAVVELAQEIAHKIEAHESGATTISCGVDKHV